MKGDKIVSDKKATILVVDDEENVRELLSRILNGKDYFVIKAASGHEAIEKMATADVDLVLLDILMPVLNGYETLSLIRQKSNVPVIMITALRDVESVANSLKLGADDYISKPFRTGELLARVKTKLRRE